MRRTHPLIVGGGPAGATAAILLARGGEKPLLIERSAGPRDIVCGGFLGWDALALLRRSGIDADALGAQPISQLHLVAGDRRTLVDLPFPAAGLSRRTLDAALLAQAASEGAAIETGVIAREIDAERKLVRTSDNMIAGDALFLATGKHELRGAARDVPDNADPSIGFRVRLGATPALQHALRHRIEMILFDRGYAGLILQEDGAANLCFTVAQSRLDETEGDRTRLLASLATEAPVLGERIGQGDGISGWASIARVPYGWRRSHTRPGVFRLGDQAAVIASLAGDGIAIALESAHAATEHYRRHGPAGAVQFQQDFAAHARRPIWIAERLRAMAQRGGLAPAGIAMLDYLPSMAQLVTRMTRISGY